MIFLLSSSLDNNNILSSESLRYSATEAATATDWSKQNVLPLLPTCAGTAVHQARNSLICWHWQTLNTNIRVVDGLTDGRPALISDALVRLFGRAVRGPRGKRVSDGTLLGITRKGQQCGSQCELESEMKQIENIKKKKKKGRKKCALSSVRLQNLELGVK